MDHLLEYEDFMNESTEIDLDKLKFKWKRSAKTTGKYSSFDNNDLRPYDCSINKEDIGQLTNVSSSNFTKDNSNSWQVMYFSKGHNIILTKKFDFEDVENAQKFFEETFIKIMKSDESNENLFKLKQRILDLGRFTIKNNKKV